MFADVTEPPREVVLVAEELREFAGDRPTWPDGRETVFCPAGEPLPRREDAVALLPLVSRPVGELQLQGLPRLRVVANYGAGVDNIDLEAAGRRGIVVTNTPDVLTDATADLTMALVLAATRRLREGLDLAREGRWAGWHPTELLGQGLRGRMLGLVGAGRIGSAVARRAAAFGMRIGYWSRAAKPALERDLGARRFGSLTDLLARADVLSVHVALTAQTRNLIDAEKLSSMRPGAVLINTARGPIVDEAALVDALRSGHLAAAGLDVFEAEPRIPESLRALPNCFLLPHLGSATREARQAMWDLAAANARAVLAGTEPPTPVG